MRTAKTPPAASSASARARSALLSRRTLDPETATHEAVRLTSTLLFVLVPGVLAGCAPESDLLEQGPPHEAGSPKADAEEGEASRYHDWDELPPLEPVPSEGAVPIFVSNNPEQFGGHGVLSSTLPAQSDARRWVEGPDYELRTGCPSGALHDFTLYAFHINATGATSDVAVMFSPMPSMGHTPDIDFNAFGTVVTSDDIGWAVDSNTPLASTEARLTGTDNVRMVGDDRGEIRGGKPTVLFSQPVGRGQAIEMRLRIRSDSCVFARVMSVPSEASVEEIVGLANRYTTYGIKSPGWVGEASRGRAAGVYMYDRLGATISTEIDGPGLYGVRFNALEEAAPAVAHYSDSDDVLWGNYGVDYSLGFEFVNRTQECMSIETYLANYPALVAPDTIGPDDFDAGWFWNSYARSAGQIVRLLVNPERPGRPAREGSPLWVRCEGEHCQTTLDLPPGSTHSFDAEIPVPSLISAPSGLFTAVRPCD